MSANDRRKIIGSIALIALAVLVLTRWMGRGSSGEQAFFYDESRQELFVGPRDAVPPIEGVDGGEPDGVRAVVVSTTGNPKDRHSRKIAYLETYSPELKRQMEQAQTRGGSPSIPRGMTALHRFVRRPGDTNWFPMTSPEADVILAEWLTAGPNGGRATICTPP